MKVKKILLSMCAIAALASCSQNDDVVPAGAGGEEARVVLKLEGDAVDTRADVSATEEGAKIKDITVFFFNTTGFIVGTPKYIGVAADIAKPITTTTDASQVVVIANLRGDETTTGKKLAGVSSIDQLKTKVFSSVTTTTDPTTKHTINQTKDRLYMSGMGKVTIGSDGLTGTATVNLHFISAKINKVAISWKADNTNQNYSTLSVFKTDKSKWFAIKQVYLMMSQTNSHLLPADAVIVPAGTVTWAGAFAPATGLAFAGGLSWGSTPWVPVPTPTPLQTDTYLVKTDLAASSAGNQVANVIADNPWYLFENPASSDKPTGLVVEVVWRSKDNAEYNSADVLTKYFTIYFGEKKAGSSPANQPYLEPGKTYDISLNLNGDFKPGGNGGGGSDDPSKPSVDANITVTVHPAKWTTTAEITKEFN